MDNGQELTDVIGTFHGTEVKHAIARLQVDGLILHRPRVAAACRVHGPGVGPDLGGQRQHRVVAVVGWIRRLRHNQAAKL